MSEPTLYREATEQEVRASLAGNRHDVQIMWVVPVEPDIDAAKAESDRQQGGPGLSRHKIAKIVNAAYAGIGADDE